MVQWPYYNEGVYLSKKSTGDSFIYFSAEKTVRKHVHNESNERR